MGSLSRPATRPHLHTLFNAAPPVPTLISLVDHLGTVQPSAATCLDSDGEEAPLKEAPLKEAPLVVTAAGGVLAASMLIQRYAWRTGCCVAYKLLHTTGF